MTLLFVTFIIFVLFLCLNSGIFDIIRTDNISSGVVTKVTYRQCPWKKDLKLCRPYIRYRKDEVTYRATPDMWYLGNKFYPGQKVKVRIDDIDDEWVHIIWREKQKDIITDVKEKTRKTRHMTNKRPVTTKNRKHKSVAAKNRKYKSTHKKNNVIKLSADAWIKYPLRNLLSLRAKRSGH